MTVTRVVKSVLASATLLLCACQPQTLDPMVLPEHELISCEDYALTVTSMGVLYNNVWNKQAAGNTPHKQCIIKRSAGLVTQFGWRWNWPVSPRAVFGQPQIKIGSSPWSPEPKFNDDFPLKISELGSLKLAHELDVSSNGDFNVVSTMWLTKDARSVKESIVAELMIWTYYTKDQFAPGGKKIETFELNGVEWEFWEQERWDDKSGLNQNRWRYLAFRVLEPSLNVEVDANALIQRAVGRDSIDEQWYIADLELGTEVMGGEGLVWIKQFDVQLVRLPSNRG